MAGFFKGIFGDKSSRALKIFQPLLEKINALEPLVSKLSPEELCAKTEEFKKRLAHGETLDAIHPEAFAVVREAAKRTVGERPFDVQLLGGMVLHQGKIVEMRTGEGKTLVATLPAYANALFGKGVHVVTVNDYLARRDTVWMGQIYHALGLTVGCINHEASYRYDPAHTELDAKRDETASFRIFYEFLRPSTRREAYEADITYGTNNEFGFDYLRDHLAYEVADLRQRGFHYAIVDEVDSILIDEARTPLIISAPTAESEKLYVTFAKIAAALERDVDYTVDEKFRAIQLSERGIEKAERALGIENLYTEGGVKFVHHLETAVRAKALFRRDKDYVVKDGQITIVDEFTGRLMPGRRWSEGLHQAIEAKEGVPIEKESRTFASITFQNYFRQYEKLSGMTGTAVTSAEEFYKVYGLDTIAIPTNKPSRRIDGDDLIFQTEVGKFMAITKRVKELHEKGQPVLVGTVSIEKNEALSVSLRRAGIPYEVLNAKNHEREGEIIAQAGRKGMVTISTNMAGRGVDIKLGGNPAAEEAHGDVVARGGLFVLGTERHEARRIDNQLRGRSGRQGDPGETQFFVSLEDTLMRVFASDTIKKMMGKFGIPEHEPIANSLISRALESAQTKIEGFNFDARKHILQYDDVLNHQRNIVYARRQKILSGGRKAVDEYAEEILRNNEEAVSMIEAKKKNLGVDAFYAIARRIILQTIDLFWVEHLELMEYMRSSVNLRAYGQRDPLVEYKREGLQLFKNMQEAIGVQVLSMLSNVEGILPKEKMVAREEAGKGRPVTSPAERGAPLGGIHRAFPDYQRIGRNDPCPCGAVNPVTGKVYKYKQCGLKNTEEHRRLTAKK